MTEKFLMARIFFRIFTENNPVMGYSKTFFIPEAKGLRGERIDELFSLRNGGIRSRTYRKVMNELLHARGDLSIKISAIS